MEHNIVIVGGGLAGAAAAEQYRKSGGSGRLTLVSRDPALPVHRPPLSKGYLRGDESLDSVWVHPAGFYADNKIDLRLKSGVKGIDRPHRQVVLDDGTTLQYDALVLATGARPRPLPVPGGNLDGVFYLRSLGSSERLRKASESAQKAVIIGAGFIGMEVAATLTQRGVRCTVVDLAPRIWPAIVPPEVSDFLQRRFEREGVRFVLEHAVRSLQGDDHVRSVILDSGETLAADLVVAGVGAALNLELAEAAGLEIDRGVVVDQFFRTADPAIYAAGDIAAFPDRIAGRIHLEHWDNALYQGRAVGQNLSGDAAPFDHVAYFFSDLFDLSLNMVGYPLGSQSTRIEGRIEDARFTAVYSEDDTVRAALMVNDDTRFDEWRDEISRSSSSAGVGSSA